MVEKYKLNLIVAFTILLVTIWLIWAWRVWDWTGYLLLLGPILLIMDALFKKEKKPTKLLEFTVKSLVVCYVATSIIWFIWLHFTSPQIYTTLDSEYFMNILVLNVLPLSLFPTAISVIIYGIFRVKLRVWEVFLSSWYASIFVFISYFYFVWRTYQQTSYSEYTGPIHAGALSDITLGFFIFQLSFFPALIYTIIYTKYKKSQIQKPTQQCSH
jgi:hypothetical protein